jgi:hypothetical protein
MGNTDETNSTQQYNWNKMDQNQYLSEQQVIGTENNCDAVSSE